MVDKMSAAMAASLVHGDPTESVGFLNDITAELWEYINATAGPILKEVVEPMFADMLPGPLSSLHFTKIDLGKEPIKLDRIDVQRPQGDIVKLDVDIFWDSDCDIQLAASLVGSFGVRHVKLKGRVSLILTPLLPRLPLVAAIQFAFINPPLLRLDFTGVAGVAEFAPIEKTVYNIINDILGSILVFPNRLLIKLDPSAKWYDTYQHPIGFLRVSMNSGTGFTVPKQLFKDIPDVYCKVRLGGSSEWRTKTINNSIEPVWEESNDYIFADKDQLIALTAMDDDLTSDDILGRSNIKVGDLMDKGLSADLPLLIDEVDTGASISVSAQVFDLTSDLSSFEADEHAPDNLYCGLLTILVAGVRKLPIPREDASSFVKVSAFEKTFNTMVVADVPGVDAVNPNYDASFRIPLTKAMVQDAPDAKLTLMNHKAKLGSVTIPFADITGAEEATYTVDGAVDTGAVILARFIVHGITLRA